MSQHAPFVSSVMEVQKDWIDYNGHMNMAFYTVLFDRCADQALDRLGMGLDYVRDRKLTIYTAEIHLCYVRELHLGDRVTCSFRLLDADDKRIHVYQELHHVDGWLSATAEVLSLHIDMAGPKVAPFPADIRANIEAMRATHDVLPRPERAGRSIAIMRK